MNWTLEHMKEIAVRMKEMEERAAVEGWSDMRRQLESRRVAFGKNIPNDFLLDNGRDYAIGQFSFSLPRQEAQACFANATHLAVDMPHLTYVEGKVACFGVPLDHAWCIDQEGLVVDPTIRDGHDGHISGYFGIAFRTDYVRKAALTNRNYGVLDYFHAGKTAPQLYKLGLEAGQQWLLKSKVIPKKKKAAR